MLGSQTLPTEKITPSKYVGMTNDNLELFVDIPCVGQGVDKNKRDELETLLKKIKFKTIYRSNMTPTSGFFSMLYSATEEISVKIFIPVPEIQYLTIEYLLLKRFINTWDKNLIDEINKHELKLSKLPSIREALSDDKIPVKALMLKKDGILIDFLYYGRGMTQDRTKELDKLLRKIPYQPTHYRLFARCVHNASAVQIDIPANDILQNKEGFKNIKSFLLIWYPEIMETFYNFEDQIRTQDTTPIMSP